MGKVKTRIRMPATADPTLVEQLLEDKSVRSVARSKSRTAKREASEKPVNYVDASLTQKILHQAWIQQAEIDAEDGPSSNQKPVDLSDDTESDLEEEQPKPGKKASARFAPAIPKVSKEDEDQMALFMSADPSERKTLYDVIQERLTEKRTEIQSQLTDATGMDELDDRVTAMYKKVGQVLCRYRAGKLPKAFKVVPTLTNWEQILFIMEPDKWTAASVYQATRIFACGLRTKMAQRFFNLILLPRVRDDIDEYKRLNVHLYSAVKKSLYKPGAFFKGFLLPLCDSGTCSLQESVIIASVLARNSIPMLHSAAAILKLAEMKYNGACSVFLRTMLNKKYALPYRVVDAVVYHFIQFQNDNRDLPVLWHQALLVFAQRYKEDISSEQKESLLTLIKKHKHHQITEEIRREIMNSKCRDEEMSQPPNADEMME